MKTVLLSGATGLVGRAVLDLLLQDPFFIKVKVVARRPLYMSHPKLSELTVDFDQLDQVSAELSGDVVICCLGSTIKDAGSRDSFLKIDHDYPLQLAKFSHRQGSRHFIVISSIGADQHSLFFYSRVKGLMQEDIKQIPFISTSFFQPPLIDGKRKEVRVMEQLSLTVGRSMGWILRGPLKIFKPVKATALAKAICHDAKNNLPGLHYYTRQEIQDFAKRYTI